MSMDNFHTLTQLLDNAGCQYKILILAAAFAKSMLSNLKPSKKTANLIHGHCSSMLIYPFLSGKQVIHLGFGSYVYRLMNVVF